MENLKPNTQTVRVGKRTLALQQREWKGKPQVSIIEVVPLLNAENVLESWAPVFKGVRLNGTDKDLAALGQWLVDALTP